MRLLDRVYVAAFDKSKERINGTQVAVYVFVFMDKLFGTQIHSVDGCSVVPLLNYLSLIRTMILYAHIRKVHTN